MEDKDTDPRVWWLVLLVEIELSLDRFRACPGSMLVADDVLVSIFKLHLRCGLQLLPHALQIPFHHVIRQAELREELSQGPL